MMKRSLILAIGFSGLAFAHPGHLFGGSPFSSGLLHPLSGLDHLMVAVAVGLYGSLLDGRKALLPALSFVGAMVLGALFGLSGYGLPLLEGALLLSVFLSGALLLIKGEKLSYVLPLIALFGFLHGNAHGVEAPQTLNPALYVVGFVLSTSSLHAGGILFGKAFRERFVRLAGASMLLATLLMVWGT